MEKSLHTRRALIAGIAATGATGILAAPAQAGPGDREAAPAQAGPGDRETRNKRRLTDVFRDAAERGTLNRDNDFYREILHPDVVWTVASATPSTYRDRADFLARGAAPILQRLATPIYPRLRSLYADGDTVVTVFDGTATALDGVPYRNTYSWIFTMRGRQAIRVEAFLDLVALHELLDRVPPAGSR